MKPAFGGKKREFLSKRNLCHFEKNLDNLCRNASSMTKFENKNINSCHSKRNKV